MIPTASSRMSPINSAALCPERSRIRAEGGDWRRFETELAEGKLVRTSRLGPMKEGVTYEFRVEARRPGGQLHPLESRENGEPMTRIGPFRTTTEITDLSVDGKPKVRLRYGKRSTVTGVLSDRAGEPVAAPSS